MKADIQLSDTFPHGTPEGFAAGCRGSYCPAAIACRDVHRRYAGDWWFRRQLDAGRSVAEIRDAEAARAAQEAEQARQAVRTHRVETRPAERKPRPRKARGPRPSSELRQAITRLHGEGLSDTEIAQRLGKTRDQVCALRQKLNLPFHPAPTLIDKIRPLHAQGLSDTEIARELNATPGYIGALRRQENLPKNVHHRSGLTVPMFIQAHAEGLTDRQMAERFGLNRSSVTQRRNRMHLPPNSPTKKTT